MVRPLVALAHVDQEHREPVGALCRLLARRGARQQHHQVGMLGARGPDLLAVDDVVVAVAHRGGADRACRCPRSARSRRRPAGAARPWRCEAASAASARRCRAAAACPWCTSARGRRRRCRREAWISSMIAAARRQRQPAAAVFLRDQRGEEAGLGQRRDELGRIGALAVELAPVFAGKAGAERAHRGPDRREIA